MNGLVARRWRYIYNADLRKAMRNKLRAETVEGQIMAATSVDVWLAKVEIWEWLTNRKWSRLPIDKALKAEIIRQTKRAKKGRKRSA